MKAEAETNVEKSDPPDWVTGNKNTGTPATWRSYDQPGPDHGNGRHLDSADDAILRRPDTVPIPAKPPMLGPMSKVHTLPAKAKPGRKALPDSPNQDHRRKTQNRNSQRKFRDKRQQKLSDAEEACRKLQGRVRELEGQQLRERAEFRDQLQRLERENYALQKESQNRRDSAEVATEHDHQTACAIRLTPANAPPTPTYVETDFTNYRGGEQQRPSYGMFTDADCGFCTDDGNCYCKQQHQPRINEVGLTEVTSHPPRPGKCSDCLQDPARAAACRAIAKQAQAGPARVGSAPTENMITCSTFMNNAAGELSQTLDLFRGRLHAHPTPNGGWETEEREAAMTLTALQQTDVKKAFK